MPEISDWGTIPSGWNVAPLGNFTSRVTYGFTNPMPITTEGPYLVTAKDVRGGRIDYASARHTSEEAYASKITDKSRPRVGDVLLTKDGSIGRVAVCDREQVCINQSVALLQPNELIESNFLAYLLQAPYYQRKMEGDADGSTIKHIYITKVDKMLIAVPAISEQRAVGQLLGALDDKIAVNERIAATYEQLLQCRFAELGLGDEPDGESEIPITDLIAFGPKLGKPAAAEPVYVDMAALQTNRAGIPSWTRREPKSGPRFMNGDTLMARITPCLENGKTGYVDFMDDGEIGLGSTEFIVLRSLPGVPSELSYFLARDSRFREHAIRNMVGSSGRQRVSAADASNYTVMAPDAEQLAAFGKEASAAFAHMKSLESESRTLAALRDTLLPQLMSGRIRVKDAEKIVEDHV